MKPSKFCLVLLVIVMGLWGCPKLSAAAEQKEIADYSPLPPSYSLEYVSVQFKDFPFWLLRQIKDMAPAIRQEMPPGLQIGQEQKEDRGFLLFSYQKSTDGVLLSMRFQHLPMCPFCTFDKGDAPLLLDEERLLSDPTAELITEALRDMFANFCIAWEQNRSLTAEEEIASTGLRKPAARPDRISLSTIDMDN